MLTCRACGARLADGAAWCSLCFAPVSTGTEPQADAGPDGAAGPATVAPAAVEPDAVPDVVPDAVPDAATGAASGGWSDTGRFIGDHALLRDGDARGWRCAVCDAEHPVDETVCAVCGASLFSAMQRDDRSHEVSASRALWWSLVPGGGQWVVGQHLQAPARFVTTVLALAAAFAFPGTGAFLGGRLLFIGIGVGFWVVGAYDARAVATGRPPLLTERRLLWTSAGLLGLLIMTVMVAVIVGVTANA